MRKIIYYVATSLDGYIAGPNEDISLFMQEGEGVQQYLADLQNFDTVIMGRKTYEFGFKFGLKPGQRAYPHMNHYIFSNTLKIAEPDAQVEVKQPNLDFIWDLKEQSGTDIYLCGGGDFAGWLFENGLIDVLKVKLNPIVLGDGIKLFGSSEAKYRLKMTDQISYEDGLQIITYDIGMV